MGRFFCVLFFCFGWVGVCVALDEPEKTKQVYGSVVDEFRMPMSGVIVFATDNPDFADTTNARGVFNLTVPLSTRSLIFGHYSIKDLEMPISQRMQVVMHYLHVRHEFSVFGGGGVSLLGNSPNVGNYTPPLSVGAELGLGYIFFFSSEWGLSTGVSAAYVARRYASAVDDSFTGTYNGIPFQADYTADYTETQGVTLLSIPLMAHFQMYTSETDKSYKLYLKFGGKFKLPIPTSLNTYNGTLDKMDVTNSSVPDPDMPSFITVPNYMVGAVEKSNSGPLKLSGFAVLGSIEVGKKWGRLTKKWSLYGGIYADYAIINEITAEVKPDDKKLFIPSDAGQINRPTGVLFAQKSDGTPFVDNQMLSPLSVGVKVSVAYGNRPRKKQLIPPVLQLKYPASYIPEHIFPPTQQTIDTLQSNVGQLPPSDDSPRVARKRTTHPPPSDDLSRVVRERTTQLPPSGDSPRVVREHTTQPPPSGDSPRVAREHTTQPPPSDDSPRIVREHTSPIEKRRAENRKLLINTQMIAVQELRKKIAGKKRLQMSINFEFGRSDLPFDSIAKFEPAALLLKQRLDEKIRLLKQSPNIKIQIEGHTDDIGTPEYNMTLGQERAETVKAYLLEKGVPAKMIVKTLSKAATEPLVPNSDEENRQKNRRVEIVVVE